MARTPRIIEWCRVHQANGRGYDPHGKERCFYATVDMLINKTKNPTPCDWVIVSVMVITPKPDLVGDSL